MEKQAKGENLANGESLELAGSAPKARVHGAFSKCTNSLIT